MGIAVELPPPKAELTNWNVAVTGSPVFGATPSTVKVMPAGMSFPEGAVTVMSAGRPDTVVAPNRSTWSLTPLVVAVTLNSPAVSALLIALTTAAATSAAVWPAVK